MDRGSVLVFSVRSAMVVSAKLLLIGLKRLKVDFITGLVGIFGAAAVKFSRDRVPKRLLLDF